jgi:uncharacterized protein YkwD
MRRRYAYLGALLALLFVVGLQLSSQPESQPAASKTAQAAQANPVFDTPVEPPPKVEPGSRPDYKVAFASSAVIAAVNHVRTSAGSTSLNENELLDLSAMNKAYDLCTNDYWAHIDANGKNGYDYVTDVGYQWSYVAENLAENYQQIDSAVAAWQKSPEHYLNMVNPVYTDIGSAAIVCPVYREVLNVPIIVNHFGGH